MSEWIADWEDVLRRSGQSRARSRRVAAIAAVAAIAVVLVLPGIGIGGGINALFTGAPRPGIPLSAELSRSGRLVGTLSVRVSRLFVVIDPKTGRVRSFLPAHRPGRPVMRPTFSWNVDLTGAARVSSIRILANDGSHVVARLCSPCSDGAHGVFQVNRRGFGDLFKGIAVARTSRGTARGTLRLKTSR